MKLIAAYIRRHAGMFFTAVFFLAIETAADLFQPAMMSYVVDNGVKNQDVGQILRYGALMLLIAAFGAVGAVMRNICASYTSQTVGRELRMDLYEKVQSLSFENIDRLQPSSIVTRITNDVTQIQRFVNGSMRIMLKAPVTCLGAVCLVVCKTPDQIPMLIVILVISGGLILANMKIGYRKYGILQQKLDQLNKVSREFLSGIRVVKAFRAEKQEEAAFDHAAGEFADAGVAAARTGAFFAPLINLTVNLGIVALLWMSAIQPPEHIGSLMASVNYMTQILFSLARVSGIMNAAVRASASAGRVREILEEHPVQENGKEKFTWGQVAFEEVSFTYAGTSRPALEHISFQADPGETIGIIGPTGAGKSTLVQLIPRFYDATSGVIRIGGKDIKQMDAEDLRSQISLVPQKALLFSGTIAENIRWGRETASFEEVREAGKSAWADDFIMGFPMQYETVLGQGGVNVSGGQKQRISIARGLLRRPGILILDDCTSALDAATEAGVLEEIRRLSGNRTVFLISQRISTVMRADRILCMEDGEIKGIGTHKELLQSCSGYQAIYYSQIGDRAKEERRE